MAMILVAAYFALQAAAFWRPAGVIRPIIGIARPNHVRVPDALWADSQRRAGPGEASSKHRNPNNQRRVETRATVVFGSKRQGWNILKKLGRGGWRTRRRFLSQLEGAMNEHDR